MKSNHSTGTEIPMWKKWERFDGRSYLRDGVLRAIREKKFETALGLVCMYENHMHLHSGIPYGKNPHINETISALENRIKTSLICSRILGETYNPFCHNVFNDVYDRAVDNLLRLCKTIEGRLEYNLERGRKDLKEARGYIFNFSQETDEAIELAKKGSKWSNALNRIRKPSRKNAEEMKKRGVYSYAHSAIPDRIFSDELKREKEIESYRDFFSQKLEEAQRLKEERHQKHLELKKENERLNQERKSKDTQIKTNEVFVKPNFISRLKRIFFN